MRKRNYVWVSLLLICLIVVGPLAVQAAPVGTFIEVEGTVDLLKAGKVPAVPAKVQGPVEVRDLVRTKTQSRAQIKFVDDTVLTIAPDSGITIEEYMFDAAKSERKAVVGVLRGLVETAVEKVYPKAEPDFIMKTHTAVLGVRGTKWYTKLLPTDTDIYTENEKGLKLEVKNIHPEIPGVQIMGPLQFVRVGMYTPPTVPVNITPEDLKVLAAQMKTGIGAGLTDFSPEALAERLWPPLFPKYSGERSLVEYLGSGFYVPPRIAPPMHIIQQTPVETHPSQPIDGRYNPSGGSPGYDTGS
jgi:FecR protein